MQENLNKKNTAEEIDLKKIFLSAAIAALPSEEKRKQQFKNIMDRIKAEKSQKDNE